MHPDLLRRLDDLIVKHGLEDVRDSILKSAKPSLQLLHRPGTQRSRIGGLPLVPSGFAWPKNDDGEALTCVAQLDLSEVAMALETELPRNGLLTFFYDVERQPSGGYDERSSWRVAWFEDTASLGKGDDIKGGLPELPVMFVPDITVPWFRSIEMIEDLPEEKVDAFWDLREELAMQIDANAPLHRVWGHPDGIQGCMQRQAQFESRNEQLADGVYSYYEHPRASELIPGAHDWRLLLQIDSDDALKGNFGDAGRIYFWSYLPDLVKRDFSRAWLFMQCH